MSASLPQPPPKLPNLVHDASLTRPPPPLPPTRCRKAEDIPWGDNGADYICESTGVYTTSDTAAKHTVKGGKKVCVCAWRGRVDAG